MLKPLDIYYDSSKLLDIYNSNFSHENQILISSPTGRMYKLPSGDLRKAPFEQSDCTILNKYFEATYVEHVYKELDSKFDVCRGRFMKLDAEKRAYSYHQDITPRIHIPLQTNDDCMFYIDGQVVKMPELGRAYLLNTTLKHSALNLSWEDRIHFVVCLKEYSPQMFYD